MDIISGVAGVALLVMLADPSRGDSRVSATSFVRLPDYDPPSIHCAKTSEASVTPSEVARVVVQEPRSA